MQLHARRSAPRLVLVVLGKLLGLAAAVAVAGVLVVVIILPRAVHGEAMTVLTGSMEPSIPTGSLVLVRPVDPRTVEVGDVVTYQVRPDEAVYITHRVADIRERRGQVRYVLRGDANNVDDEPILGDRIRGEVWFHVPHLGTVRDALTGRGGLYLVATLLLGLFACLQVTAGLRERREQRGAAGLGSGRVRLDRPAVVLSVAGRTLSTLGLSPDEAATRIGGLVLSQADDETWLLVVGTPGRTTGELVDDLSWLEPSRAWSCESGTSLALPGSTLAPDPAGRAPSSPRTIGAGRG